MRSAPLAEQDDLSIVERVDAIIAAIEPPVTRAVMVALAGKAHHAALHGPRLDRAEWAEIARELRQRIDHQG